MSGNISGVARGVIYLGYDVGGSFFVGLYRVANAVSYIFSHFVKAESYREAHDKKVREFEQHKREMAAKNTENAIEREKEDSQAEMQTQKAVKEFDKASGLFDTVITGTKVLTSMANEKFTKGVNIAKDVADTAIEVVADIPRDLKTAAVTKTLHTFEKIERAKMNAWKGELLRGFVELIPIVGGLIYTYYDLSNRLSPLGLDELRYAKAVDDCTDIDLKKLGTYFS